MEFMASILDAVCRPMKDYVSRTYGYVMSCGYYIEALGQEMDELKSKRDDVKRMVDAAERQGMEATSQVKWWLECVSKLEDAASQINLDYQARLHHPRDLKATYRLSQRADETLAEAACLKDKANFDKVADELVQIPFEELPSAPDLVGMDVLLDDLRACVHGDVGVIGVHGMAGVGKTALLGRFNNDLLADSHGVNVAIYIEVGRELTLDDIQRVIADRLGVSSEKYRTPKERAGVLHRVLSKMSFVLMLDDLWEPLNLRALGIPAPKHNSKSKIVVATRIEDVCDRMDVRRKLRMDPLPWEPAWELFRDKVGDHLGRHAKPEILELAEKLAKMCGGLPLALITVGRAMASKRTAKEWKHAITVLKIAPWHLLGMEKDVLTPLKNSYDNLPSDKQRLCLLYCSLFPEKDSISKDWIIGYCIGEGFIDEIYTEMDEVYNKGHDLLADLKIASLLEKGQVEEHISMHPMVRAMALWIASDLGTRESKWLVRAEDGLKEAPYAEKWSDAERISFMWNQIVELYEVPNCPMLKTLMLHSNLQLHTICDGFFRYMPSLRVLDLSCTFITELPSGMDALVQLQYLDLYNTNITSLPREIGALVTLRFLLLSDTPLEMIPCGVIRSLTMLEVLYMDFSYREWKLAFETGDAVDFQEIESLRRLKALDITIQSYEVLETLAESYRVAGTTRNLQIISCTGVTDVVLPSGVLWKNMASLQKLWIVDCGSIADVFIDGGNKDDNRGPGGAWNDHMGRYTGINTRRFSEDKQPILPNLQEVTLQSLHKVKKIIYIAGHFQHLSSLYIWFCNWIEVFITLIEEEQATAPNSDGQAAGACKVITPFPNLKLLHLLGLPRLRTLSSEACVLRFPSLASLLIEECRSVKKLKLHAPELKSIQCKRGIWDELEWDDDEFKASLQPLYRQGWT